MVSMVVTLDVLKFSGWLNFRAICRVERRSLNSLAQEGVWGSGSATSAHAEDSTVWRFGQGTRAASARGTWRARGAGHEEQGTRTRRTQLEGWGQGTRGERTENISSMVVTLDVSKLTGWLNLCATCRVERRACAMTGEVRAGRRKGVGQRRAQAACTRRTRLEGWHTGGECTENMWFMSVTLDVSKLTGWLKGRPSRTAESKEGHAMRSEMRAGRRRS